ncbi:hypothetical protein DBR17_17765 [Sphingomonas sp. HMWF008]|nr:hypothetical protein DBR17_17765 [Sphingomonas sp. HMWF008]
MIAAFILVLWIGHALGARAAAPASSWYPEWKMWRDAILLGPKCVLVVLAGAVLIPIYTIKHAVEWLGRLREPRR